MTSVVLAWATRGAASAAAAATPAMTIVRENPILLPRCRIDLWERHMRSTFP